MVIVFKQLFLRLINCNKKTGWVLLRIAHLINYEYTQKPEADRKSVLPYEIGICLGENWDDPTESPI